MNYRFINIGFGDWNAGNHPVDITIPAGGGLFEQVNITALGGPQRAVEDLLLTANGTDLSKDSEGRTGCGPSGL